MESPLPFFLSIYFIIFFFYFFILFKVEWIDLDNVYLDNVYIVIYFKQNRNSQNGENRCSHYRKV